VIERVTVNPQVKHRALYSSPTRQVLPMDAG
jgi:hypothetical protein